MIKFSSVDVKGTYGVMLRRFPINDHTTHAAQIRKERVHEIRAVRKAAFGYPMTTLNRPVEL